MTRPQIDEAKMAWVAMLVGRDCLVIHVSLPL